MKSVTTTDYSTSSNKNYVRRLYNKFRSLYFQEDHLPDFRDLDFEFEEHPGEWGYVEWCSDGLPHMSIDPAAINDRSNLKGTLLHEMVHLKLGKKRGHGKDFLAEALRIMNLGALKEFF
jgi:hypothetical protein